MRLTPVSRYSVLTTPWPEMLGTGISSPEKKFADCPLTVVRLGRACTTATPLSAGPTVRSAPLDGGQRTE